MNLQPRWLRIVMVLLAVPNLITGLWAIVAPRNWFDNFPGWAPELVAALPPYNEHLATDAGAGLFASGLVMLLAVLRPQREIVITAAVAYLAFALPHFAWHLFNPADALEPAEDTVNAISLALAVVGAGAVLMWQWHPTVVAAGHPRTAVSANPRG
jgi:hypothetical protein